MRKEDKGREEKSVHILNVILPLSAIVHPCCTMALWGGQAKGEMTGGRRKKEEKLQGETELMTGRRSKRPAEKRGH